MAVEINQVFEMFDQNKDGKITMVELQEQLENMGIIIADPELAQMIDKVDANGDRCVDQAEFRALYQLVTKDHLVEEEEDEEGIEEAFEVFDKNRDGFISVEELRTVLVSLGLARGKSLGLEDCRQMITGVDLDGDGLVSFLEFKQMMVSGGFANVLELHA